VVDCPGHNHAKSAPPRVLAHPIESRTVFTDLCAANSGIVIFLDHFSSRASSDLAQLSKLIFDGLLVRRYPNVNCIYAWLRTQKTIAQMIQLFSSSLEALYRVMTVARAVAVPWPPPGLDVTIA
jgi:hypothetical protein